MRRPPSPTGRLPWLRLGAGLVVSIVAAVVVVLRVDLREVMQAFEDANYVWLVPAVVMSFLSMPVRAERWRVICYPVPLSFGRSFGILSVGASLTSLLPLRLGDVVRAYLLGELERRSKAWALATLVVERLLDLLTLLVITVVLLPFVSLPAWAAESAWIAAALAVVGVAVLCVAWFGRSVRHARVTRIARLASAGPLARVRTIVTQAVDGLAVLGQPLRLLLAVLWSGLTWITAGVVMWCTLLAFGIDSSPFVAMLLVVVSAVTVAVPLSPSAVGVFHAAVIQTLVVVSPADTATATSFAISAHLLLFAPPVICGLASVWLAPDIADRLLVLRWRRAEQLGTQVVRGGSVPPA
jgi:uncharacterized protein (TIRG00374 family)